MFLPVRDIKSLLTRWSHSTAVTKFINSYSEFGTGKGQCEYTKSKDRLQIEVQGKDAERVPECM